MGTQKAGTNKKAGTNHYTGMGSRIDCKGRNQVKFLKGGDPPPTPHSYCPLVLPPSYSHPPTSPFVENNFDFSRIFSYKVLLL